jgi:putative hydrolase
MIQLDADNHVHSTFSGGRHTIAQNVSRARRAGLTMLGCVDHVRRDTRWVPAFCKAVDAQRAQGMHVIAGVEARLLDAQGTLDLPEDLAGVERVYVADDQFPWRSGVCPPEMVRDALASGELTEDVALQTLVDATVAAVVRCPRQPVIAHLFRILPKIGLREDRVTLAMVDPLISAAITCGALLEVDERWRCPSVRVASWFHNAGVPVIASADSRRADDIGVYPWLTSALRGLD